MGALEKRLLRKMKNAIYDFEMIKEWETILVWISGWKDSMLLWYMLSQLRRNMKEKFEIKAVYIYKDFLVDYDIDFEEKRKYFEEKLNLTLEKIDVKIPKNSKLNDWVWQSCQRCSYARRIAMMKLSQKYKATKICYWHHMDDIVVTTLLNMIEWRNLKIMPPINKMKKLDVSFIRPMAYLREKEIMRLVNLLEIPYSKYACPIWENTMRNKIKKDIVWKNEELFPKYTENIFWAFIKDFKEKYQKCWYNM